MRAVTLAIAACLALGVVSIPASVPLVEEIVPVGHAEARPGCVIGPDDCIIPMYCVMEPCPSWP